MVYYRGRGMTERESIFYLKTRHSADETHYLSHKCKPSHIRILNNLLRLLAKQIYLIKTLMGT